MFDNYEFDNIDKDEAIKFLSEQLQKRKAMESRFFELAYRLNELAPYMSAINDNIAIVPMIDQVRYMECAVKTAEIAKEVTIRYGLSIKGENDG